MSATNIEKDVKAILKEKGKDGWLRTEECAEYYAKDDDTRKTRFYRLRKKVEKREVHGFQVLKFQGNVSYIGLESANPRKLELLINADKPIADSVGSVSNLWTLLDRRAKRKNLETHNRYRRSVAPALAYFRRRAKHDGIKFYENVVKEEDKLDRKIRKENKT